MSESVTSADRPADLEPARGSMVKRVLIGSVLLLLAVIVLAELGIVSAESSKQEWSTESEYQTSWNGRRGVLRGFRFEPAVHVAVGSGAGAAVAKAAAETIRKTTSGTGTPGGQLDITINSITMDGASWLPFFRDGSCRFTASYTLDASAAGSHIHVQGTITGKVEQSTKGLSSLSRFREHMGKTMASAIINEIQKMIAKNG